MKVRVRQSVARQVMLSVAAIASVSASSIAFGAITPNAISSEGFQADVAIEVQAVQEDPQVQQLPFLEVAERDCAVEVAALQLGAPKSYAFLREQALGFDETLPAHQHTAFNKFTVFTAVLADQTGKFVKYISQLESNALPSNEEIIQNRVLLALTDCLMLSESDRASIVEMVNEDIQNGKLPADSDPAVVFKAIDEVECKRWLEAHRRVLAIDPASDDAASQMEVVLKDTVGRCLEGKK